MRDAVLVLALLVLAHLVADFVLQTGTVARRKSGHGADAALGPAYFAACLPAVREINAAGGVLGHKLSCQQFDTRGEPADAVPAARQMIASPPSARISPESQRKSSRASSLSGSR